MKSLLLLLFMTMSIFSFSQDNDHYSDKVADSLKIEKLELERKELKKNGFTQLGVGLFTHMIGALQLVNDIKDPEVYQPFALYNGIGLSFDILALTQFNKSRKIKKQIKLLKNTY